MSAPNRRCRECGGNLWAVGNDPDRCSCIEDNTPEKPKTPIKHGTIYGYKRQLCRCDACRAANADYSRSNTDPERHRIANRLWYEKRGRALRSAR